MATLTLNINGTSADDAFRRFDSSEAAAKYRVGLTDTPSHRREMRCIRDSLSTCAPDASVLDLPCGTGRLLPDLCAMGFHVTAADSSPHMINQARAYVAATGAAVGDQQFVVASVFNTPFADDQFDAVVCNRLMHHFDEPDVRRAAMRELDRICRGPIVVSFFNARTFLGYVFNTRNRIRTVRSRDRVPITPQQLNADAASCGLHVHSFRMTRRGISKQTYAVLRRASARRAIGPKRSRSVIVDGDASTLSRRI